MVIAVKDLQKLSKIRDILGLKLMKVEKQDCKIIYISFWSPQLTIHLYLNPLNLSTSTQQE